MMHCQGHVLTFADILLRLHHLYSIGMAQQDSLQLCIRRAKYAQGHSLIQKIDFLSFKPTFCISFGGQTQITIANIAQ